MFGERLDTLSGLVVWESLANDKGERCVDFIAGRCLWMIWLFSKWCLNRLLAIRGGRIIWKYLYLWEHYLLRILINLNQVNVQQEPRWLAWAIDCAMVDRSAVLPNHYGTRSTCLSIDFDHLRAIVLYSRPQIFSFWVKFAVRFHMRTSYRSPPVIAMFRLYIYRVRVLSADGC